jgi:hypothetical protein
VRQKRDVQITGPHSHVGSISAEICGGRILRRRGPR